MRTKSACVPSIVFPKIQPPVAHRRAGFVYDADPFVPENPPGLGCRNVAFEDVQSVPQIVVLTMRTIASVGAVMTGFGLS